MKLLKIITEYLIFISMTVLLVILGKTIEINNLKILYYIMYFSWAIGYSTKITIKLWDKYQ